MFFGGGQQGRRKGPDASVEMEVSLEDLYNGAQRSARISRNVICPKCRGSGAKVCSLALRALVGRRLLSLTGCRTARRRSATRARAAACAWCSSRWRLASLFKCVCMPNQTMCNGKLTVMQMQETCPDCGGRGNVVKTACPHCGGKKASPVSQCVGYVIMCIGWPHVAAGDDGGKDADG
jgi:DnaJ-class molecular chaperone